MICVNVFKLLLLLCITYADDIVLLSPSWQGMQELLNVIEKAAIDIDMTFNTHMYVLFFIIVFLIFQLPCAY